jgi:serine/threonine protein kinase
MHRDLSLDNLFIKLLNRDDDVEISQIDLETEQFCIKITSFGKAKLLGHHDRTDSVLDTSTTTSPEAFFGNEYNHKRDVWSLGVIFFELITGQNLFNLTN